LLMILAMNNENVGLRYANPTYQLFTKTEHPIHGKNIRPSRN